jgi:hypothetical protein
MHKNFYKFCCAVATVVAALTTVSCCTLRDKVNSLEAENYQLKTIVCDVINYDSPFFEDVIQEGDAWDNLKEIVKYYHGQDIYEYFEIDTDICEE